jgi:CheY-like chemotaxis protein
VLKQACQPLLRTGEWLHQVDDATLAIVSPRHHADKLARLICKQFDQARAILHDADDLERGFMLCRLGGGLHRQPLLHVNIGVINAVETTATQAQQVLHQAQALVVQLNQQPSTRSRWLKHTLGLPMQVEHECPPQSPADPAPRLVWIAEPDAALAYLLSTTLGYQGLKVDAATDNTELTTWLSHTDETLLPNVVLLDAVTSPLETVEACCKQLKRLAPCAQVVVATAQPHQHDDLLGLGAHWLVSKPYDVLWLMSLLQRLSTL